MKTFLLARTSAGFVLGVSVMVIPAVASAATFNVSTSGLSFLDQTSGSSSPDCVTTINVGDTVHWSIGIGHDVVSDAGQAESFSSGTSRSLDYTFTRVGTFTYFCTSHAYVGMFGSVVVQGAPSNRPPSVSISSPANGSVLPANSAVAIKANAADIDPGGSVTSVQFFDGGTPLGTANVAPFEVTVNLSPGPHTLTARATDNLNAQTTSAGVGVTVVSPAQLRITSTERRSPNLVLAFASTPGLKYVVETNTVLSAASWKPLVTNIATAASTSVTNLIGPAKVFYRVALVP